MSEPVKTWSEDGVGVIELARPDKFNCLSRAVHEAIDAARRGFEADPAVRAILLRAQGKHFCTGADLAEVKGIRTDAGKLATFIDTGNATLTGLEASPLPVVCAVQGLCLAGGLELMLAADVCIAADVARFGDQHAQFGLVPGWGGSQRLTRLVGLRRAMDLLLTARWIEADEALSIGLVNRVVPLASLEEEAMTYTRTLATRSRPALAEMKRLARQGLDRPLEDGIRLERDAVIVHLQGDDVSEGLAAFEGRRTPRFTQQ
ncbi:MAG: enoyl-CoA hydratase/isomerase family protein [Alphaproteobacteria bacterium]|nr:enoyl-CoA hydratase/isomerase family protein [Alphaproteobacteria bacterium]MDX5369795.1 enoyl-CoA hydratase/isomerase family protein [Alphaproteobacteria bacterium]MDX5464419.1 enoyl-CoA hydratase/isomerase family protein [Alphaproteobacteria bacterium]